ncbi:MAG TPA: hypothetical protein VHB48_14730 [Chitinophagaceae bacterium]|nr:hypothetical protein [Chitinophagaceae bacterium]
MSVLTENKILQHITGKHAADDITIGEMQILCNQYPSFGPLKFLLAKKAMTEKHANATGFAEAAALHFSNPYWLHFKLNEETFIEPVTTGTPVLTEISSISGGETPVQPAREELSPKESETGITGEPAGADDEPDFVAEVAVEMESWNPALEELIIEAVQENEQAVEELELANAEPPLDEDNAVSTALAEDEHPMAQQEEYIEGPLAESEPSKEEYEDADAEAEEAITNISPAIEGKISSVLQGQLAEFNKPVTEETPLPIETEPYHTVDYFASQGIKLTNEQQKQDVLVVKVKKFTDWLKQMKRVSPAPADLGIDEAAEHKVQDIAAGSNEPKEIVTETMAEVLAMQGMTEKAIQVYIKLSFLDPSKTAYFASKIEKLKGF